MKMYVGCLLLGKISKSSLQNLERILKQKSTEIVMLRQQLEKSVCIVCSSKQLREVGLLPFRISLIVLSNKS